MDPSVISHALIFGQVPRFSTTNKDDDDSNKMDIVDDLFEADLEWDLPPVKPRRCPSSTSMSSASSGHMDLPADSNSEFDSDYPNHPTGHSDDEDPPPVSSLRRERQHSRKVIESDKEEAVQVHVRQVCCAIFSSHNFGVDFLQPKGKKKRRNDQPSKREISHGKEVRQALRLNPVNSV